ncbi:serine O-acetyltransferase [Prevotella sp.]|uniref:serine O-acetyltransferase n=1 Tax=Prevotella sp. TaxID=59823 RepID=UPI002F93A0CA
MTMTFHDCKRLIAEDYRRIVPRPKPGLRGRLQFVRRIFRDDSFCITFWFRLGNYCLRRRDVGSRLLLALCRAMQRRNVHRTGIQFYIGTEHVGGGLRFFHFTGIVSALSVRIGTNCSIHHGVTLGRVYAGPKAGCPTLGDNVMLFPGAKVVGKVTIGDGAVVATNAVVVDDVPAYCVVAGNPAKVVSTDSSKVYTPEWLDFLGL